LLGAHHLPDGQVRAAVLCFFFFGGIGIPAAIGLRMQTAMLRSAAAQIWLVASSLLALSMTVTCAELHLPIWAYVFAISGGPTVVAVVQTVWVMEWAFPDLRPSRLTVRPDLAWSFLRASSFFAIMSLSAVVSYSIDSLVVSAVLGASTAAVFALAARTFTLVGVTVGVAGLQMWSALSDAITRGDHAWARSRFRHTLLISTGITTFACGLLVIFGRQLTRLWVGGHLVPPLSLLIVLAVYTVYSTTFLQASYLLAAVGRVRTFALFGIGGATTNLVASIWLTHVYGLTGPILGSLVAFVAVMTVPLTILLRRELRALD
jgi:O-antigen/teichoic acid export membrane protein